MAFAVDRLYGQDYTENIIDSVLLFESGTWSIASGTGTASLDVSNSFVGSSALKIENNNTGTEIIATNTTQNTVVNVSGRYQFSFYVMKSIKTEFREGAVLIYKNASLLDTQSFTIGSTDSDLDVDEKWLRFQSGNFYDLEENDIITFQFRIDSATTAELTTVLWFDGIMLSKADKISLIAPFYTKPDEYEYLKDIPTLPSADGNYQLTVSSGVYSWTEIV